MIANPDDLSASEIAHSVAAGKMSALSATEAALARISKHDPVLNSFTDVTAERARARARTVDAMIAAGQNAGPLAGVPFAVKNLFDVQGLPTRAGSKINRDLKPSARDATLIERMEAAGAVLVGALNMGEYAYDFTGENVHDGPSRNPHDVTRMTGGSSGGSGGAVGGGLVPLALGSDTNGSIRVPSSFCGIFGLKPTYGRLSRARSFPFVASFDHLGPFARNVRDLALAYDAMQGPDAEDAACTTRPAEPVTQLLAQDIGGLRIAVAGGFHALDQRGIARRRLEVAIDLRSGTGRQALHIEQVLHRERHTGEWAGILPRRDHGIDRPRLGARALGRYVGKAIQGWIVLGDPRQRAFDCAERGHFSGRHRMGDFRGRQIVGVCDHGDIRL